MDGPEVPQAVVLGEDEHHRVVTISSTRVHLATTRESLYFIDLKKCLLTNMVSWFPVLVQDGLKIDQILMLTIFRAKK